MIVVALVVLLTGLLPLAFLLFFGERSVAIVRQSRLLWLNIPGSRDAVRNEIEKVLWRNLGFGAAILAIVAAIAASPLVGAGAARALLGLAVTAGAAIYGTYVAMAAVPSVATYFWGFGSMVLLQLVLLLRPEPSLTAVAVVAVSSSRAPRCCGCSRSGAGAPSIGCACASRNAGRRAAIAVTIGR